MKGDRFFCNVGDIYRTIRR